MRCGGKTAPFGLKTMIMAPIGVYKGGFKGRMYDLENLWKNFLIKKNLKKNSHGNFFEKKLWHEK